MPGSPSSDDALGDLFDLVANQTGCDFSQYKPATLARRIEQRFRRVGCDDATAYLSYVRSHTEESERLLRHLLIGVTAFFRNPKVFETVGEVWHTAWTTRSSGPVRLWVPACSTGEEAYSLAIQCLEFLAVRDPGCELQVFATDVNSSAVDRARKGWYSDAALSELEPDRIHRWFDREARGWRVKKELREHLTFAVHNLLTDPPFGQLDMISCRNLFIYLDPGVQTRLTASFAFSLKPLGLLLLGTSESADPRRTWFDPIDKKAKLYGRRPDHRPRPPVPTRPAEPKERRIAMPAPPPAPRDLTVKELVLDLIARDYAVPSVLVDAVGVIQFVWGDTTPVFRRRAGRPTDLVVENVAETLQVTLANALATAAAGRRTSTAEGLRLPEPDNRPIRLTVRPVEAPILSGPHYLVVFQILEERLARGLSDQGSPRADDLERELNDTRLYLRNLVLKLENANEELAASNEETQSMNEELQSSNEELESSREELQATNDELETVNATLALRIDELAQSNNDLANLIASARLMMVFLDRQKALQRFTPEAGLLLGLTSADLGRNFPGPGTPALGVHFDAVLDRVLRDLQPEEREVPIGGRAVQVKVLPYRPSILSSVVR
jgi:two-component system CheB/CheR fusion protein